MTTGTVALTLIVLTSLGCAASRSASKPVAVAEVAPTGWDQYWRAHHVSPPPPPGFLDEVGPLPRILNRTDGAMDDETVRHWVAADLRRGRGDGWAARHLRLDAVNADVFGPPGLNGTEAGVKRELAAGAAEIVCSTAGDVAAAAVIAVPRAVQKRAPDARLTDFVIVLMFESAGRACERVMHDGRREPIKARHAAGDLSWQLDAGEFRQDPVVGPLWYQSMGWSCSPDSDTLLGQLCGVLQPERPSAAHN
jgi:hypothetical protein